MSTTIENIIYFSENSFYKIEDNRLLLLDTSQLNSLSSYSILIDDNMFFYESVEISVSNKKKLNNIVKNYLQVSYPEETIQNFKIINLKNSILVAIPSDNLISFIEENNEIFKKAKKISTIFAEILLLEEEFIYKFNDSVIVFENNQINYEPINKDLKVITDDSFLSEVKSLKNNFSFTNKYNSLQYIDKFKIPLIIFLIAYLLFVAGEIFRVKKIANENDFFKSRLNKIYLKAGVAGKADPYGLLLYKAKNNNQNNKFKIAPLIERISRVKENTIIDSLNFKNNILRFSGNIKDFTTLENFKKDLENQFNNAKVVVTDTKKTENMVNFSIRIEL